MQTREICFYISQGLHYKDESTRPKKPSDLFELTIDKKEIVKKVKRHTPEEIKKFQAAQFNLQ